MSNIKVNRAVFTVYDEESGGCIIPTRGTEERRAWFAKHFPAYVWPEKPFTDPVDGSEISADELASRILSALRDMGRRVL